MNFDDIYQSIINDKENAHYTNKNIMPLYQVSKNSKIVIIGQAPGLKTIEKMIVWDDLSGDNLRNWLGIDKKDFYNPNLIAHIPMDFYYPGKGSSGDLPPRSGFAEKWHPLLLSLMPNVKLIILIGTYAQKHYLKNNKYKNLTETVKNYKEFLPNYFPLVHPSPLNFRWFNKNPWFIKDVVPDLKKEVHAILD